MIRKSEVAYYFFIVGVLDVIKVCTKFLKLIIIIIV